MIRIGTRITDVAQSSDQPFRATQAYGKYVLVLLLVVAVVNYADRYMLGILLPAIKSDLDLSDTQIGFITGVAFTLLYAFLGIPIARLADQNSRKKIIAVALAAWSVMTCMCGLAQSFMQLAIFRVLVGVGEAGCTPPSHSLISDYYSLAKRTSALAIFGLGSPLGAFVGFLVGGWLAEAIGWRLTLIVFGAPGLILALIVYLTLRDPPRGHADGIAKIDDTPEMLSAFKTFAGKPTFWHMILGGSMYGLIMIAVLIWIPSFFVRAHGLDVATVGTWLAFTNGIPHALGVLAGGFFADRLSKYGLRAPIYLCVFAQLAAAPFYAVVLLWPTPTGAFLWLIIPSFVGVMQGPVLYATVQAISSVQSRAFAAAFMILIINLISGIIGPQLVGIVSDLLVERVGNASLGISLLSVATVCSLWSALHFYLASKHIERDMGRA